MAAALTILGASAAYALPLDYMSLQRRSAVVEDKVAATPRQADDAARDGFMSLNRAGLTVNIGLNVRKRREYGGERAERTAEPRESARAGVAAEDAGQAVLMLFDDREIERAHPFGE